jgi:hypothetical protein
MIGLLSAMVVLFAPDVRMGGRLSVLGVLKEQRLSIKAVFEDGFYAFVRAGPYRQSPDGGLLEPFRGVMFAQAYDAKGGTEALLGVRPVFQDSGHQFSGVDAVFACPGDDSGGSPLQMPLVAFRHVFRQRFKACGHIASFVDGHSAVFEQHFHGR